MPAIVTGKRPGDLCPGCKEGRLTARTIEQGYGGGGIGGNYSCRTILAHLVCVSCSGMYEAIDRGRDVTTILEAQLKGFENPATMPTACATCGGTLVDRQSGEPDDCITTRFRSCEDCLTVAWVFPEKQQPETGWSPRFAGDRPPPNPPLWPGSGRRGT